MAKIAVFPASGKLGTKNIPSHLLNAGAIARRADYNEVKSLDSVFEGASGLILISYPSIEKEHRFNSHKAAIDAARLCGISYVFDTSLGFGGDCTPYSVAYVMQAHLLTESYLRELSNQSCEFPFSFTAIREGIYSESFPMYTGFPSLGDFSNPQFENLEVRIPHDGLSPGVAWAKIDDLGEASAKLIKERLDNDNPRNDVVLLSGPRSWSIKETINLLRQITGKKIHLQQMNIEDFVEEPVVKQQLGSHGPGNQVPQQWATVFEALRRGECAVSSTELRRLLGREPEPFEVTLRNMLEAST